MLKVLKWLGTAAGILGAFIVAANLPFSGWGFLAFLTGSVSWVAAGLLMREPSIWLLNGAFTVANIVGIWRWLMI